MYLYCLPHTPSSVPNDNTPHPYNCTTNYAFDLRKQMQRYDFFPTWKKIVAK